MIPKVIHYCWFGRKHKPYLVRHSMRSWNKILPGYTFILWNEDNFDITCNRYVRQAYDAGQYAFVSDYVRLYALYNYGGIYLDTDVEVLKPFDSLLNHQAFAGYEEPHTIGTGIIGAIKGSEWIGRFMRMYDDISFLNPDGSRNLTTNVMMLTKMMQAEGFRADNTFQDFPGLVTIYPSDWFCPRNFVSARITLTPNTHTIHHYYGSWIPWSRKQRVLNYISRSIDRFHLRGLRESLRFRK